MAGNTLERAKKWEALRGGRKIDAWIRVGKEGECAKGEVVDEVMHLCPGQ